MNIIMIFQYIFSTVNAGIMIVESFFPNHPYRPLSYLSLVSYYAYDAYYMNISREFLIHHGAATVGILISYMQPFPDKVFTTLSRIEIPTIVFNAIPFVNDKYKQYIEFLFFISFFKYRIYDGYYMFQENIFTPIQFFPLILFYSVYLYWFVIMCKKIGRVFCKPYNLTILQHQICSYTMAINSAITIYRSYPYYSNSQITSAILALTSYVYHQDIIKNHNGITPIKPKWIKLDITAIHLFHVVSLFNIYEYWYILAGIHLLNILYIYIRVPKCYIMASIPSFFLDYIIVIYHTRSIELYTNILLQLYFQLIQPYYDLTFAFVHVLIIWYTYTRLTHILYGLPT